MAFRLRMPAEIGDWLAELAGSQPEVAAEIGAALLALMAADSIPGLPLVADPDEPRPVITDPRELLDYQYQQLLEEAQHLRLELAEAAHERDRTARLLQGADAGTELRPYLERRLAAAQQLCDALSRRARRVQFHVDTFRVHKETAKAAVTAEEARLQVEEALQAADLDGEDGGETTDPDPAVSQSAARLQTARDEAFRLLGIGDAAAGRPASRPESDVLELSPDPLASGVRVLFAEEPTGTITVLTALENHEAVAAQRDMAIDLACELLEEIRDDGWPTESLQFEDGAALLARFFPGRREELTGRASAFGTALALGTLRERAGLTAPGLARKAGLSENIVQIMESDGTRHADVRAVAAYARALGGTLRLTISMDARDHLIY